MAAEAEAAGKPSNEGLRIGVSLSESASGDPYLPESVRDIVDPPAWVNQRLTFVVA
jgi:hypothetical protein